MDAADLRDRVLEYFLWVAASERGDEVELSRNYVCFDTVGDGLELLKGFGECSLHLHQCEGYGLFPFLLPGVGYLVHGEGCLGMCYILDFPDLLDGVEGFLGVVGFQFDDEVESACDWGDGFNVRYVL